jgi:hypothetical protein
MTARYSHVFEDDLDRLAEKRDAAHRAASQNPAAYLRPASSSAVLPLRTGEF